MDEFVDVTRRGLGGNLRDSIAGVLFGGLLFLAAFPLLWWNEGRLDISKVAKKSVVIDPASVDARGEGKLVSLTGMLAVDGTVGDPDYLKPGPYLRLDRRAEMYAWIEKRESHTEKKLGGGSETITTYSYYKDWTAHPKSTGEFKHPAGHENPPMRVEGRSFYAARATVGAYAFKPSETELPSPLPLSLDADSVIAKNASARLDGGYLYRGAGSSESPQLGDVRLSFLAVSPGEQVTLFGKAHGGSVEAFVCPDESKLLRVMNGERDQAIARMHGEYEAITWILRGVGFAIMWIGLALFFGPVNALLDIVPFLGSVGRFLVFLATLPVAFSLSLIVIAVSIVAHNPILLGIVIVGLIVGAYLMVQRNKARKAGGGPQ